MLIRDIIPKRYDPIILLVEDRIDGESLLFGYNKDSIPAILRIIQQTGDSLQTFLNHCCTQQNFPEMPQTFSYHLFDDPEHIGD